MNDIKMIYGIDSLYYFCESNENYDDLFLDILDQMEDIKGKFDKRDIEYENNDINITINQTPLNYLGKNEGFYWFKDICKNRSHSEAQPVNIRKASRS